MKKNIDFNPRTPCGVRLSHLLYDSDLLHISIHAPLAGCDDMQQAVTDTKLEISIHAPLTGCDPRGAGSPPLRALFQSTHPSRGATLVTLVTCTPFGVFQSTHPLRGATRQ